MTMTLPRPIPRNGTPPPPTRPVADHATAAAHRLRAQFAAVRVSFTWLGVRKTLTAEQKTQVAESFGAQGQYLSAAKKLLDTRDAKYRAVTAVRSRIVSYWKALSLPYPEPGLRLIRHDDLDAFNRQLARFQAELTDAVAELDEHFESLRTAAAERLGTLFDPADYPPTLRGLFEVTWEFPSVEPPEYLLQLSPALYQQERHRMAARFDEAVHLAEQAFVAEFSQLVSHLVERLTDGGGNGVVGGVRGEPKKVFRDSAVTNLHDFINRFKTLNVRSNAELDHLVDTAKQALSGVAPAAVRNAASLRKQIGTQLAAVQSALDGLMVDQPRRRILRSVLTEPVSTPQTAPAIAKEP